ncbi:MAG: nickel pincer cofactor biosynthesis protein LarC [Candidatus Fermentibacteraceae bacterium]|nr:nickel pincer cofactor biosynthesis protein LarC [Candidatus Fermentibacteraceae bacterium]
MKIAVFNPVSGISGNMILGALIDNGLAVDDLIEGLKKLPVSGWSIEAKKVLRGGLQGTHVEVKVPHEHVHRHLSHIKNIIEPSSLDPWVKEKALKAFQRLAEAEAESHGIDIEEVHFHEVGAMDAIIDVVGSCLGLHLLGVEAVFSGAVSVGTGTVECAHGTLPLPAPATARLLKGVPVVQTDEPSELTTPTGAAVLTALVESWDAPPVYRGVSNGMGAGTREGETRANLLRLVIGEAEESPFYTNSSCLKIEAVIDDLDPRVWPLLSDSILKAGALDCFVRNCMGKKGRPAMELVVLLPEDAREAVLDVVFTHSSTLGVRISTEKRLILNREFKQVVTRYGTVSVKLGYYANKLVSAEPEFDECAALADAAGLPAKIVLQEARGKASELFGLE